MVNIEQLTEGISRSLLPGFLTLELEVASSCQYFVCISLLYLIFLRCSTSE